MKFLRSPLTWILLALGMYLSIRSNNAVERQHGVDAIEAPYLIVQALIGTAILVAIVCGVASINGDKFTWTEEGEDSGGKAMMALKTVVGVIVLGFLLNAAINYFDPMENGQIPAQIEYAPVRRDDRGGFR